jgi:hypothetical protein
MGLDRRVMRVGGMVAGDEKDLDDDEMEVDEAVVKAKETAKEKGTKRLSEEDTLQEEKPKKKVRSA